MAGFRPVKMKEKLHRVIMRILRVDRVTGLAEVVILHNQLNALVNKSFFLPEPDWVAIARYTTKATKTTQIMSRQTPNHLMVAIIKNQV